jgi:hypothetical protein
MPNSGSTSIEVALVRDFGGEKIYSTKRGLKEHRKHATLSQLVKEGSVSKTIASNYLTAVSIRNPFDRVTSNFRRLLEPHHYEDAFHDPKHPLYTTNAKVLRMVKENVETAQNQGFDAWVELEYGALIIVSATQAERPASSVRCNPCGAGSSGDWFKRTILEMAIGGRNDDRGRIWIEKAVRKMA